jgi:hypothetical protein
MTAAVMPVAILDAWRMQLLEDATESEPADLKQNALPERTVQDSAHFLYTPALIERLAGREAALPINGFPGPPLEDGRVGEVN